MKRLGRRLAILACTLAVTTGPADAGETAACPAGDMMPVTATHSRAALADRQELLIVALGSSSTQSWMSSDPAHSYPAVLQHTLAELLPGAHVAVINRGVGGQDAAEEVARIDSDVIAIRPSLVIWQVGANGALRSVDPVVYKRLVTAGVQRMQKAGIDVVLMDNQRSPQIVAAPQHVLIDQATAEVAVQTGSGLLARGALMDAWRNAGVPYDRFISPDGLHQNDLGYRCLGEAAARAIVAGLGPDRVALVAPGGGTPAGSATR